MPDVLQDVPGLNVVQTGGAGGTTSVFMRGTNANHTKVFIDGIDVERSELDRGTVRFRAFPRPGDIERVEVLRGPQSGLYGADAIGGVINIITKKGAGPAQLTGSVEGGSFGTFNQSAGVSGSRSRFNYDFDVAHFHSDDTPVTPLDLVPPGRVRSTAISTTTRPIATKLGADLTDNFDVGLVARYIDTTLRFTGDDLIGPESHLQRRRTNSSSSPAPPRIWRCSTARFDQTLGHRLFAISISAIFDPNFTPASGTCSAAIASSSIGRAISSSWPAQILTLGAEHQRDEIDSTGPVTGEMTNDAGFCSFNRASASGFSTPSACATTTTTVRRQGDFSHRAGLAHSGNRHQAQGSVGTGFKPPTLAQLFQSFPAFGFFANPNLKPETSLGYDFGFEQTVLDEAGAVRRHLFPQRHQQSDQHKRHRDDAGECRQGHDLWRRELRRL